MKDEEFRIVVVDDLVDAATTLAYALELDGYQTRVAHDGVQGLAVIEDFKPHCVLFDIDMPHLNGFELAKQLRARYQDDIVLIAVTAALPEDERVIGSFNVADHYLLKPVSPQTPRKVLPPLRP